SFPCACGYTSSAQNSTLSLHDALPIWAENFSVRHIRQRGVLGRSTATPSGDRRRKTGRRGTWLDGETGSVSRVEGGRRQIAGNTSPGDQRWARQFGKAGDHGRVIESRFGRGRESDRA